MQLLRKMNAACLLFALLAAGCDKPDALPGTAGLLVAHGWKMTVLTSNPAFPSTASRTSPRYTDLIAMYRDVRDGCSGDQHLTFAAEAGNPALRYQPVGTYQFRRGNSGCGSTQVQAQGDWAIDAMSQSVTLSLYDSRTTTTGPNLNSYCTLLELSANRLIMECPVQSAGLTYTWHYVFEPE